MRYVYLILFILLTAAILLFTLQNFHAVSVEFLAFSFSAPLSLLFLAIYLLGMISGSYVFSFLRTLYKKATPVTPPSDSTP